MHNGTWQRAALVEERDTATAASCVWQALSIYAAYRHLLVSLRPAGGQRNTAVRQHALSLASVHAARGHVSRQTRRRATERTARYMELLSSNPQQADAYLSTLLKEKGVGLALVMEDPFISGRTLVGKKVVLRGGPSSLQEGSLCSM